MRKLLIVLLALVLLLTSIPAAGASALPVPNLEFHTDTLLLVDRNTGDVIYSRNADKVRSMASITKVMTYIVTVESISDLESTAVEITEAPVNELAGLDAYQIGLSKLVGKSVPVKDLLYAMMLSSACDAANVLAWHVAGSSQAFVEKMNAKAKELGCENTQFADSYGLSAENHTTAYDLVKIANCALEKPLFQEIVSSVQYQSEALGRTLKTSVSIQDQSNSQYYYQYAKGIKTGFTYAAGRCLLSTAEKDDSRYLCVALGAPVDGDNYAILDSIALYNWAFNSLYSGIQIGITPQVASVQLGGTLQLSADVVANYTEEEEAPVLTWSSSDSSIATVDETGLVTGLALGQATIQVETQTGHTDSVLVSCGMYNGADVSDADGAIDWTAAAAAGLDFVLIHAGGTDAAAGTLTADTALAANLHGAVEHSIPAGLIFTAAATDAAGATQEAEFLRQALAEVAAEDAGKLTLPVFWDLSAPQYASLSSDEIAAAAGAFSASLQESGFSAGIMAPAEVLEHLDSASLEGFLVWRSDAPASPNLTAPTTGVILPDLWRYTASPSFPTVLSSGSLRLSVAYTASAFSAHMDPPEASISLSMDGASAVITWSAPNWDPDGYRVLRWTEEGSEPEQLALLTPQDTFYTDWALDDGVTYIYSVAAFRTGDLLDPTYQYEVASAPLTLPTAPAPIGPEPPSPSETEAPAPVETEPPFSWSNQDNGPETDYRLLWAMLAVIVVAAIVLIVVRSRNSSHWRKHKKHPH